jgi:23S rRNA (adenine2503-C2)-methyltransferase
MKILAKTGREDIATVYIAEMQGRKRIEFVESVQPPIPREKKWVLILSSLYGCCVNCRFCDAGGNYQGIISKNDLFRQIDFMVKNRYPSREISVKKFKIQFARMGEPAFNMNVIDVLSEFYNHYKAPGFMPSISTIAPQGTDIFFEKLIKIKKNIYKNKFQIQFSIHSTDTDIRNWLIPIKKWDFETISQYGEEFFSEGDRKITLNFALGDNIPVEPSIIKNYFSPDRFLIKFTPVNPTYNALKNGLTSHNLFSGNCESIFREFKSFGYEVILSVGELEENLIGSNCGQYLENYEKEKQAIENSYNYELQRI